MTETRFTSRTYSDPAPEGWEFTGEFRPPARGEVFLTDGGNPHERTGTSAWPARHILRAVDVGLTPPFVTVKTEQTFLVQFPGDDEPYELTEQEANQLFRALNEVL